MQLKLQQFQMEKQVNTCHSRHFNKPQRACLSKNENIKHVVIIKLNITQLQTYANKFRYIEEDGLVEK